ncbi:MAG TPA: DUF3352 domain-containing protein, partial [Gemmataceae bacterium]|nr:DUF3352 domain-containing protein [Gemmataceae bacterium]
MRTRAPLLAAALALVALAGAARAESKDLPKDAAGLFPAHSLAYLEVRQPDKLSREVAALCNGSVLEDMPARMAQARAVRGNRFFFEDEAVGLLSVFLCPEMVAEFARLGGGAVALTGFTKDGEPEVVGVVLSGESNAPTFILRMALTLDPQMRQVGDFEGLKLYREQRQRFVPVPKPGQPPPPPPMPELYGPTYCLFPGGLVIGSTTDSVKEVIRRMKGKTSDPSLANVAAFRDQAKLRDRAGLFGYADLGALGGQLDAMARKAPPGPLHAWNNYVKDIVNGKAVRVATVSLTLEKGNLELQARVGPNPKETSPLVEALPAKKASPELLHFLPADTTFALTAALPDGAKRWEKVLALADAAAKAEGRGGRQLPSQALAGLEEKLQLAFGKDVAGKLDGVVLALDGRPSRSPATGWLLVVRGTDPVAAQALEEKVLPKLAGLIEGKEEAPVPAEEKVDGQSVRSLPARLVPGMDTLYFGRQGKVLVVGADRKRVADSLAGGRK